MRSEAEQFLGIEPDPEVILPTPEISLGIRSLVFWVTWLVALVAACPSPEGIPMIPLFPVGLALALHLKGLNGHETEAIIVGWLGYLFLSIVAMTSRTKWRFWILYGLLFIILLLNVGGCHSMWKGLSRIH